jgi:hypothetical protein
VYPIVVSNTALGLQVCASQHDFLNKWAGVWELRWGKYRGGRRGRTKKTSKRYRSTYLRERNWLYYVPGMCWDLFLGWCWWNFHLVLLFPWLSALALFLLSSIAWHHNVLTLCIAGVLKH